MMFDTILFDADRTIFDNDGLHELVAAKILEKLNIIDFSAQELNNKWVETYFAHQEETMLLKGFCIDRENQAHSLVQALDTFGVKISFEQADTYWAIMLEEYTKSSKPYPEISELLQFLEMKGIKKAIVSNGDYELIMARLEANNIADKFEFVLAPCEEYPMTKPNKEIFLESLKKIGSTPEKTIFIGDTPEADIKGANQVGLYSVLVDKANMHKDLQGDLKPKMIVRSLLEITKLFK
jgi:putative hydrolase of the HAD superfamily